MSEKLNIEIGTRYGKLVVVSEAERRRLKCGQTNRVMVCLCDCGNTKNIRLSHLIHSKTESCGCIIRKQKGLSTTKIYSAWKQMKDRCKENYVERKYYFDKGISVCEEWKNDFIVFYQWSINNGFKDKLQLDRIDGNKGYCPENCRYVTSQTNRENTNTIFIVNYKSENKPLKSLLREIGKHKNYAAIRGRLLRGWNHDLAIDTEIREGNYIKGIGSRLNDKPKNFKNKN